MSENEFSRAVGVIGKPYGIKGYFFIQLFTDYPNTIKKTDILYLDEKCEIRVILQDVKILNIKHGKNRVIWKFLNIDNKNDAEKLRNNAVYRHYENQPVLEKNVYWADDLVECTVFTPDGSIYGEVVEIEKIAYNDNLIIKCKNKKIDCIPLIDEYIKCINIEKKEILLEKLPEYI